MVNSVKGALAGRSPRLAPQGYSSICGGLGCPSINGSGEGGAEVSGRSNAILHVCFIAHLPPSAHSCVKRICLLFKPILYFRSPSSHWKYIYSTDHGQSILASLFNWHFTIPRLDTSINYVIHKFRWVL